MHTYKIGLIAALLFCLPLNTIAQKYYEKNLNFGFKAQEGNHIANTNDGNFFISGSYYTDNPLNPLNPWQFCIVKITPHGDTLWVKKFPLNENRYNCNTLLKTEYGFMLALSYISVEHRYVVLLQIDEDGNILHLQNVGTLDYDNVALQIIRTKDMGYLIIGKSTPTNTVYYPYALRVDSNLQVVWEHYYSGYNTDPQVSYLIDAAVDTAIPDNDTYYLWGLNYDGDFTGAILLLQINDSDGEKIMDTLYRPSGWIDVQGDYVQIAKRTTDGGFIASGEQSTKGVFMKFDADLNLVWTSENIFNRTTAVNLFELADGSFVGGGCIDEPISDDWNMHIAKVNSNGSLRWQRSYGSPRPDFAYGMTDTSDGGYIITGRSYVNDTVTLYLLKTNCMGLLSQPQANFTAQTDSSNLIATFQNLSQYVYADSLDGGYCIWDFGDGNASLALHPTHSYTQAGTYTVTLRAIVCTDTSTWQQSITVGKPLPPPIIGAIKVMPNPVANNFIVSNYSLSVSQTIVLYDLLGRKVLSQALLPNQTVVSVSHLPAGMYLCKVGEQTVKLSVVYR